MEEKENASPFAAAAADRTKWNRELSSSSSSPQHQPRRLSTPPLHLMLDKSLAAVSHRSLQPAADEVKEAMSAMRSAPTELLQVATFLRHMNI